MKSPQRVTQLTLVLLVIAALIGWGCAPATYDVQPAVEQFVTNLPEGFYGIKPVDALKAIQSDPKPFVLDVRESKEIIDNGYIEGAVNIPLRELTQNLDKLPAQDQPIFVYCSAGHRGAIATTVLQMLGYTNVKSILGGLNAWKTASLPVMRDTLPAPIVINTPNINAQALAVMDGYLTTLPDGFFAAPPATVLKDIQANPQTFVLDVREPGELTDNGLIQGAVNIPLRELFQNLNALPQDKNTPIVTYCAVGHRGAIAMTALQLIGYTNVRSIGGGFNAWLAASLPVVMQ
jgi:rhodanese-related sulfurtransferase